MRILNLGSARASRVGERAIAFANFQSVNPESRNPGREFLTRKRGKAEWRDTRCSPAAPGRKWMTARTFRKKSNRGDFADSSKAAVSPNWSKCNTKSMG